MLCRYSCLCVTKLQSRGISRTSLGRDALESVRWFNFEAGLGTCKSSFLLGLSPLSPGIGFLLELRVLNLGLDQSWKWDVISYWRSLGQLQSITSLLFSETPYRIATGPVQITTGASIPISWQRQMLLYTSLSLSLTFPLYTSFPSLTLFRLVPFCCS